MYHLGSVCLAVSFLLSVFLVQEFCSCPDDCSHQNGPCTNCSNRCYLGSKYCDEPKCPPQCLACKYVENCSVCMSENNCSLLCNETCTRHTCQNVTENMSCMKCNKFNPHCDECGHFWKCTSCMTGYSINVIDPILSTCIQCPQNCINCALRSGVLFCSECAPGYRLIECKVAINNEERKLKIKSVCVLDNNTIPCGSLDHGASSTVVVGTVVGILLILCLIIAAAVVLKYGKPRLTRWRSIRMNDKIIAFSNRLHSSHNDNNDIVVVTEQGSENGKAMDNIVSEGNGRAAEPDDDDQEVVQNIENNGVYDNCKSGIMMTNNSKIGTTNNYETVFINDQGPAMDNTNRAGNDKTAVPDGGDQEIVQGEENGGVYDVCKAGTKMSNEIETNKNGGGVYDVFKKEKDGVYNVCKAGTPKPAGLDIEHSDVYNRLNVTVQSGSSVTEDGSETSVSYGGREKSQEVDSHCSRHSVEETDPVYALPIKRSLREKCEVHHDNDSKN